MSETPDKHPGRTLLPGNNLMTHKALKARVDFLNQLQPGLSDRLSGQLRMDQVMNNIESFVGSMELPLGLVGPLAWKEGGDTEHIFGVVGTSEGALVASMNRGARAIMHGGVVQTAFVQQRMLRTPLLAFETADQAQTFAQWAAKHEQDIKAKAEEASNHASLIALESVCLDESVHLRFIYHTGDAAGQNMSTACTWHACQWIMDQLKATDMHLVQFGIESNGASDKKISRYAIDNGRGCKVKASVVLDDATVKKHLRADAEEMYQAYLRSVKIAEHDGMIGFNINAANAVAAFFASTGQDLACIPESSTAFLTLDRGDGQTTFSLELTNLVIGTVGGGTGLPTQKAALEMMGCAGAGKVERLASIIAGFALALELSTFAAVVGGQFARAHQMLGRNKPKNWLVRSELDERFLRSCLHTPHDEQVKTIQVGAGTRLDNGILTDLSSKVVKKLIGFVPLQAEMRDGTHRPLLVKSKATDEEIMKGLHYMASHVDTQLADQLLRALPQLEYRHCNFKEVEVYRFLSQHGFEHMPVFYGSMLNAEREIFLMMEEFLVAEDMQLFNAEQQPENWTEDHVKNTVNALVAFQALSLRSGTGEAMPHVKPVSMAGVEPVYEALLAQCRQEQNGWDREEAFEQLTGWLRKEAAASHTPLVLAHNDFNPRNIAVRQDGRLAVYDWELAVFDVPQRDLVEFLSFVITDAWTDERILQSIAFHHRQWQQATGQEVPRSAWLKDTAAATHRFLITRCTFYLLGEPLLDYGFSKRIFDAAFRILEVL